MKWLSFMQASLIMQRITFPHLVMSMRKNKSTTNGSLGNGPACTWNPWNYEKRIKTAECVGQ